MSIRHLTGCQFSIPFLRCFECEWRILVMNSNAPIDPDELKGKAWDEKFEEWAKRDWLAWLSTYLSFPFTAVVSENEDKFNLKKNDTWDILGIDEKIGEDDLYGVLVNCRRGRVKSVLPLCVFEVTDKNNVNFKPVKEYLLYFANR